MSEWWTYRPHDLLMYSARAYYGLFALENARVWPVQPLVIIAGIAMLWLLRRGAPTDARWATMLLAVAWCAVAGFFFVKEYATIHTFARFFAVAFTVQAIALLAFGSRAGSIAPSAMRTRIGALIVAAAVVAYPFLAPLAGRPWNQAELFALAPDPTVAATFGALLLIPASRWWLWIVPITWTVYNGATLWMLRAPAALVLPAIGVAAMIAARTAGNRLPGTGEA